MDKRNGISNNINSISSIPRKTIRALGVQAAVGECSGSGCGAKEGQTPRSSAGHTYFGLQTTAQSAINGTNRKLQSDEKENVDHPQASGSKLQLQRGHKVDCPARIVVKETFLLKGYQHVICE